jgi:hypothetical protein
MHIPFLISEVEAIFDVFLVQKFENKGIKLSRNPQLIFFRCKTNRLRVYKRCGSSGFRP